MGVCLLHECRCSERTKHAGTIRETVHAPVVARTVLSDPDATGLVRAHLKNFGDLAA
jgi:hypothetical protein